ncbi:hypothetical protein GYB57_06680 [bacterium]|nr:hypothetical protein [bacterium]
MSIYEIIGSIVSNKGMAKAIAEQKGRFLESESNFIPQKCRRFSIPVSKPILNFFERGSTLIMTGGLKGKGLYRVINFPKSSIIDVLQILV